MSIYCSRLGYSVSIQVVQSTSHTQEVEKVDDAPLEAGTKRVSEVSITGSFAEDLSPFFNELTDKLIFAKIVDGATAANILATFGMEAPVRNLPWTL